MQFQPVHNPNPINPKWPVGPDGLLTDEQLDALPEEEQLEYMGYLLSTQITGIAQ